LAQASSPSHIEVESAESRLSVMFRTLISLASVAVAAAGQVKTSLRHLSRAEGFVKALEFQHQLRVCNAYPYAASLDVYRNKGEKLTSDAAMSYKSCKDFRTPLQTGDKLEFKVGDASTGTFSVSDLPNFDAVLLLVIHRHDTLSTAVAFESHIFSNLQNAQVAVIDTYKGAARASTKIMDIVDALKSKNGSRSEDLRYDSVVAVNPGKYEVVLADQTGATKAKANLVALNKQSYVVLRTGVEAQQGHSFPEELVVYPQSDPSMLQSAASARSVLTAFLVAALGVGFML